MRRKILLICNGNAGLGGNVSKSLFDIIQILSENGCEVTVFPIVPSRGLTSETIIREKYSEFESLVICGGDGTLNHVINVLASDGIDIPIGYIPFGSTNDFARTLYRKDRISVKEICRMILRGRTKRYDIGAFNDEYFNYVACFGALTKVSYTTPRDLKNAFGYGAYVLNTLAVIPEDINYVRHCRFIHDGIEEEGDYLAGFVSNSISVAGIKNGLIGSSRIDDGCFELTMVRHPENVKETAELGSELIGANMDEKHISHWQVKHLEMFFDEETPWTLDGEDAKNTLRVVIDVLPAKIRIFADR